MKSIKVKLYLYTFSMVFLILVATFILQGNIIERGFSGSLKQSMESYAAEISKYITSNRNYQYLAEQIAASINGRVSVYDSSGTLMESYGRLMFGRTARTEREILGEVLSGRTVYRTDQRNFQRSTVSTLGFPAKKDDKVIAAIFIHSPLSGIKSEVKNTMKNILALFLIASAVSFAGAYLLSNSFTRPILKITGAAKEISSGNYDVRISVENRDEIGELAQTINELAKSLKNYENLRRDFIANTTHELRTPISIIKSYAEAIYDGILNSEEVKEYSYSIIEESDKLNNLVNEILELSKLQSGGIKLNLKMINLKILLEGILKELEILKGDRTIHTDLDDIAAAGDEELLKRAFTNIIINAVNHTGPSGNIYISSKQNGKWAVISISDDGPGIDERDLPYIFNRFFSKDKRRAGGLGLAIANEIVMMHSGRIEVKSKKGSGSVFMVILPSVP
ncbi:HAMP domain-containing histidine kinase [Thermovorax subterraneus]|nr:HAMP domain-containing histidine kinase [Thermovorax subterraneus]